MAKRRRVDDLSQGAESMPVAFAGTAAPSARYICMCESRDVRHQEAELVGCDCADCGSNPECCCLGGHSSAYDDQRRLRSLLEPSGEDDDAAIIIECTDGCACPSTCSNRVVSRGIVLPLEVFASESRGFALRTVGAIHRGAFVCEYVGELLSTAEAAARRQRRDASVGNYIMTVREHLPSGKVLRTNIDPTEVGNVARYINHSCDPNLRAFLVRAGSLVPRVGLFALRDIEAQEELTMFYGDGITAQERDTKDVLPSGCTPCLCGAACCTGFLPFCDV